MPDISKINAVAVADIEKLDSILAANIEKVNGLTFATAPAFTGLLDTYTGATAAYSVRQLKSGVTVAMRVRRETAGGTGDDEEADVAFDTSFTNPTISLDSAISNASAGVTATTLGQFLNVGTVPPYNGGLAFSDPDNLVNTASCFVDEWKDQSGNANHAEQSTHGSQLQIHSGTVDTDLEQEGGNPALLGNGSTNFAGVNDSSINLNDFGVFAVCRHTDTVTSFRASVGLRGAANATLNYRTSQQSYAGSTYGTVANNTTFNLSSIYADNASSDAQGFFNQSQIFSTTPVSAAISTLWVANTGGVGSTFWNGTIQEAIFFSSSTKADHTDIETNINTEYLIYQPTDAPTSGLLADYTGAAAAYSVRQLSDKAILCMRIRRDMGTGNPGDDDEINIGFDANGDLDTQAIADFCGTGTGWVTRWWDQSVNSNHADQATAASQPQIYNGSAVLTLNGKPYVNFVFAGSSGTSLLTPSTSWSTAGELEFFSVFQNNSGVGNQETWSNASVRFFTGAGTNIVNTAAGNLTYTLSKIANQNLFVYEHNSTARTVYIDGTQDATSASPANVSTTSSIAAIGRRYNGNEGHASVGFQELIHYPINQSTNRTGIESDINTYFSIYT